MFTQPISQTYQQSMEQAELAMQREDFATANLLLTRAHGLGHSVKADHLRAHRALIRLAVRRKNPVQLLSQTSLLILAMAFERG